MNSSIYNVSQNMLNTIQAHKQSTPAESQAKFATMLKSAIQHTNNMQQASDHKTKLLANGQINDLHDVMITAQKASITLETTVQVQQKVLDAYNEIMRMQV
ncbi:flagellar hook-basal body complex protein FliE [Virgibacillus sp. W0430]|uniref:flagellar hook-basal body complex protein FliE n=1 Tax=Virgibacillus sp. W0430 TaxID=3391580 RepID=UPI003F47E187